MAQYRDRGRASMMNFSQVATNLIAKQKSMAATTEMSRRRQHSDVLLDYSDEECDFEDDDYDDAGIELRVVSRMYFWNVFSFSKLCVCVLLCISFS